VCGVSLVRWLSLRAQIRDGTGGDPQSFGCMLVVMVGARVNFSKDVDG
jgi:hypothetical protein